MKYEMIDHHPLHWPDGVPRTPTYQRRRARFDTSLEVASVGVYDELRRLGATDPILSTNVPTRKDGMPRSTAREPLDPGAAIYFRLDGKPVSMACDRWDRTKDNVQALRKTIEALRGIERWGSSDMVNRAFTGFQSLPASGAEDWRAVLDIKGHNVPWPAVKARYHELAQRAHPDRGGSDAEMSRLNQALDAAKRELGVT